MRRLLLSAAVLPLVFAASAHASVTLGQTTGSLDNCSGPLNLVQDKTAAAPSYVAPSSGVVTSWSYLAHASAPTMKFKVYKPTGDVQVWFLRSESAQKTGGTGADQVHANQLNTFTESPGLRIEAGDHLGLTFPTGATFGCIQTPNLGDAFRTKIAPPDTTVGQDNSGFAGNQDHFKADVSAVVEPDADNDGFGDESQDSCTTDASVHSGPCPVDVSIVKTVSDGAQQGSNLTYTLAVKNNSAINPADGLTVTDPLPAGLAFVSSSAGQGSCVGGANVSCGLGTLAPQQETTVTIVATPTASGPLTNTASVTTTSSDTDTANNSSTAATIVAPIPPPVLSSLKLSPTAFKAKVGTLVSYVLTQDVTTTAKVSKRARGVKKGNRCVKPPKKKPAKKPKRCTRLVGLGSYLRQDKAGPVSYRYKGRLKGKTLRPGRYRLRVTAINANGVSAPASANFTIKK